MEGGGDSPMRGRGRLFPKEREDLRRPFIDVGVESSDKPNARPNVLQSSVPEKVVSSNSSSTLGNVIDSGSNITVSQNAVHPPAVMPNIDITGINSFQSASSGDFNTSNAPPISLVKATNSSLSPFAREFVPRNSLKQSFVPYPEYQEEMSDSHEPGSWFNADGYPVLELREFVYEVTLNPGKYDSLVLGLVETLQSSIADEETMRAVANTIFDQAITEPNFRYNAARLCNHLTQSLNFFFGSFRYFLLQRCQQEHKRSKELVTASDGGSYLRGFTIFIGELFSQIEVTVGDVKEKLWIFGIALTELLDVLLSNPTEDNLKCVCQVLKVVF
ncbi:polyadenylate-binding protein-interacting protein 1-like [Limulus polyphemus]|uniref:Polyadenylate-binding protein-interacting protein 1-like n=1 Tax=Limulus polyphemus TaxID=6850 RepID=A0ABM1BM10_LIMPO|nr:polyadenylate-binding protein-interacting protein 1-like [Limulus polyphemus]